MRIRTIKPDFFLHEGLFEAEKSSKLPLRLAFAGLWCAADREGRFKWEPRKLGIQILPWDEVDFSRVLDALTTRGFVVKYASGTAHFGWIPTFSKHQIINNRESDSVLPEPPPIKETDASGTRDPREDHAGKAEGKGREGNMEGKGKEGNGRDKSRGSLDELKAYAEEIGLPASDGESMFHHWEANGWKNGSAPVKNWKAGILKWRSQGWLPSQKAGFRHQLDHRAEKARREFAQTQEPLPTL